MKVLIIDKYGAAWERDAKIWDKNKEHFIRDGARLARPEEIEAFKKLNGIKKKYANEKTETKQKKETKAEQPEQADKVE